MSLLESLRKDSEAETFPLAAHNFISSHKCSKNLGWGIFCLVMTDLYLDPLSMFKVFPTFWDLMGGRNHALLKS